ncbi:MAG: Na+/H+ antiporter NhaC family protein [Oscillospiraceae bacterium]|nr:Na+/H+ antiporter NhaC family protein [Oscillospiraceae bacterium]
MEPVYVGWLSILPPVIAIVLALITKEVLFSLVFGCLSGALIYSLSAGLNPVVGTVQVTFDTMIAKADMNIMIFCFLLGALVCVINKAGGAKAYGRWATKVIHSKRSSLLTTSGLGCLIFVDDYFNCLTVGTVMKPVTDRFKVSRAKLAYVIDSTAAPVCIIAPISSWAAAVGSYLKSSGAFESDFAAFCSTIPFNLYALLSLLMVFLIAVFKWDFGPMAKFERRAELENQLGALEEKNKTGVIDEDRNGTVADMLVPIIVLIVLGITGMLYNGGFFGDDPAYRYQFVAALGNCVAAQALVWGNFAALIVAMLMYVPRGLMKFSEFMGYVAEGMGNMITSGCILMLAWTIGGICRDLLSTQIFVTDLVQNTGMPGFLLPVIIFLIAAFLSFATGTSWGTFGILIPIVIPVAQAICPELLVCSLAASLAGSVFGDHTSPISDTTILSSAGAGCNHLDHVSTQMVYAGVVASCCIVGYILAGLSSANLLLTLGVPAVLLVVVTFLIHKISEKRLAAKQA